MHLKKHFQLVAVFLVVCAIHCYSADGAALRRRTPKVYNALITTDDNLTSSRAYPVIQPTIHESGIIPPYPYYNPYAYYRPPLVRFGQPIAPGLMHREQLPYPLPPQNPFLPQFYPQTAPSGPPPVPTKKPDSDQEKPSESPESQPTPPERQPAPQAPGYTPKEQTQSNQMPNDKLPIPLNEFGLPPALIPINQYPYSNKHPNTVNLPPYGFNQLQPLLYDQITGIREQYLPPYEYYPNHAFAFGRQPPQRPQLAPSPALAPLPTTTPTADPATTALDDGVAAEDDGPTELLPTEAPTFESIKNESKLKNSEVPDVPPPPIPTGADKTKQQ